MSGRADDPDHFLQWLRTRLPEADGRTFAPRVLYGRYLASLLDAAASEIALQRFGAEVLEIAPDLNGTWKITSTGIAPQWARAVVLASGHLPPVNLRVDDGGLYASASYRSSPWGSDLLAGLPPDAPLFLVGTGLTAVDLMLSVWRQGHRGIVHALSRHGLPPLSHAASTASSPTPNPETPPLSARGLLRLFRQQNRAEGGDWRAVLDRFRPLTQATWQRLPLEERRRFLRHARSYWEVHRHRTAPLVGDEVSAARASGALQLHAGRVLGFRLGTEGTVEVRFRPRGQPAAEKRLQVSRVFNCTGPGPLSAHTFPLWRDLEQRGLGRLDSLELGIDTDARGALRGKDGATALGLYALGPLRRGTLWESTAVPEIRTQAAELARELTNQLRAPATTPGR